MANHPDNTNEDKRLKTGYTIKEEDEVVMVIVITANKTCILHVLKPTINGEEYIEKQETPINPLSYRSVGTCLLPLTAYPLPSSLHSRLSP